MKSIVQTGPKRVEIEDRKRPSPGATEVLVRVHTAGLCGSDAHAYMYEGGYEWIPMPRIMGHEYSGTVEEVGDNVTEYEAGDRIVEEPIHHCGSCFQCRNGQENVCQEFSITGMHRDGAWAEYTLVEPQHLHSVPDGVSLADAAITEPTSIATRAVFTQSELAPGDNVLVQGPGPIGTLVAVIADSIGANVLVAGLRQDAKSRLPKLDAIGTIETINVESDDLEPRQNSMTNGIGFDVIFDATGHHTGIETAVEQVRKGGQIVMVGLPGEPSELFMTPVVRGEVDLNTSYGSTWRNFEQALRLMESGTVKADEIVDGQYPISEAAEAFDAFLTSDVVKPTFRFDGK